MNFPAFKEYIKLTLLRCGNRKLGMSVIWHFDLPSRDVRICRWATSLCWKVCYMGPPQSYRSHLLPRYETNYQASLEEDFEERILAELKAFQVLVCRPHCSGEFYSLEYVRKWERIMRKARKTFFYFYSRSWQDSEIAEVFAQMASLRRVRVYFSLDRETGVPPRPHKDIRFAWLKTEPEEVVPDLGPGGLVFRSRKVRGKKKVKEGQALVCPHENGTKNSSQITCQGCQVCLPEPYHSLMRLV